MKKTAKRFAKIMPFILALVVLLAGCNNRFAEEVKYVISFAYGMNHYNGLLKTVITVDTSLVLQYHVYAADAADSTIYYSGTQPAGIQPDIAVEATITQDDWHALASSKSLAGVWKKSPPKGATEGVGGTAASILIVGTGEKIKAVGGFVIDDRWLNETTRILDHLALRSGTRAQGDQKLAERIAQFASEQEQEKQTEESTDDESE